MSRDFESVNENLLDWAKFTGRVLWRVIVIHRRNKKNERLSGLPVVAFPFRLRGYVDIHLGTSWTEQC